MRKLASRALATWRVSIEKEERDEDGRDVDGDTMKLTARQVPADDEAVSVQIFVCQESDELRVCRARLVRANNLQQSVARVDISSDAEVFALIAEAAVRLVPDGYVQTLADRNLLAAKKFMLLVRPQGVVAPITKAVNKAPGPR
eukprot:scaffold658_cov332-Pinguiococcus_pyrenoidosus.AAC.1